MDLFVVSKGDLVLGVVRSGVVGEEGEEVTVLGDCENDISASSLEEVGIGNADPRVSGELTSRVSVQQLLKIVTGVRPVFVLEGPLAKFHQDGVRRSSSQLRVAELLFATAARQSGENTQTDREFPSMARSFWSFFSSTPINLLQRQLICQIIAHAEKC